jgi:hypothetical protein
MMRALILFFGCYASAEIIADACEQHQYRSICVEHIEFDANSQFIETIHGFKDMSKTYFGSWH